MTPENFYFQFVATPISALIAGVLFVFILIARGAHRDIEGLLLRYKIASAFVVSSVLYIFVVSSVAQLIFQIPVSQSVSAGFGDERVSWLLLGASVELVFRLHSYFQR